MQRIMRIILAVFGGALMIYSRGNVIYFPDNLGSYLPGAMGLFILVASILFDRISRFFQSRTGKTIKRIMYAGLLLGGVTFISMCAAILISKNNVPQKGREAVVVLGAGLRGEQVSLTLALRLDKAVEYLNENPETIVIVSGGQGSGETVTEGYAMKKYLMGRGIGEERILTEEASTSTYENFMFSKEILDEHFGEKEYSIVYITNDFHCPRAGIYAKRAGLEGECLASDTPVYMVPSNYSREYLALAWALVGQSNR